MSLSLQFKGFNYTALYNGDYETGDTYGDMEATGINSVALTCEYGIDPSSSSIFADYAAQAGNDIGATTGYTETAAGFGAQVTQSENAGQSVIVRPLVDFLDPTVTGVPVDPYNDTVWRKIYQPANLKAFFDPSSASSYTSVIVAQAKAAQASGAQVFDIGSELDQLVTTATLGYWTTLIEDVRAVFHGQLTYSANWDAGGYPGSIGTIPKSFWQQLDYVGVDAYIPAPNPKDLVGTWTKPPTDPTLLTEFGGRSAIDFLESIADAAGKPLLMTEVGWTNASDAATNPLDQSGTPDDAEQAALYKSFFQAWSAAGTTSLVGVDFFNWNPASFDGDGSSTDFTPQTNQQALDAVKAGFSAPAPFIISLASGAQTIGTVIADTTGPQEVIITQYSAGGGDGASAASTNVTVDGANTYSGGTLMTGGIVTLGNATALGHGGLDILAGELDLAGYAIALPTLRGGGRIVATPGASTAAPTVLTVSAGTFAGSLADGASGSVLELKKVGIGSLVLSGRSSYATTVLGDGTLELAGATSAGTSAISFGALAATLIIDNAALAGSPVVKGLGHVFGSALVNLRVGDKIVLKGVAVSSETATASNGIFDLTMQATGIGGGLVTLQFAAVSSYAAGLGAFSFQSDGHGDTIVSVGSNPVTSGVAVSTFAAAKTTLDKIAGGFTVADTAADIVKGLSRLAADLAHITVITATDTGVVVSLSDAPDLTTLDRIVGGFGFEGSVDQVLSNLDGIEADIAHVKTVKTVGGSVAVTVATFMKDRAALDEIAGGYRLVDAAAAIQKSFDTLAADAGHVLSVAFTDASAPVLKLSQAQASNDAALVGAITGPYVETVANADKSTTTTGHGNGLTLTATRGTDALTGGGSSETFVFGTRFGQATIADLYRHASGSAHDTIALSSADFASFAAVLHDATYTSAGAVLTAPSTGDTLTLAKMTAAALAKDQADFTFA